MKNIYLIGMRGVGKSSIGQLLAEKLGKDFVDLDKKIEQKIGADISSFVQEQGWNSFRELEKEQVNEIILKTDLVVGTGGGVLMYFDNAEKLKNSGNLILLTAPLQILQKRLEGASDRPALTEGDFLSELEHIWNERKDRYHLFADKVVDTEGKNHEEIVQEIMKYL